MNSAQKKGPTLDQLVKGFTLIELLVVIAIVGVLAAVVLLAINPARRLNQARDAGRKSDIAQIATAAQAFFTSNEGSYAVSIAAMVTSQDLKTEPRQPGGGAYSYTVIPTGCAPGTATPCAEVAVFATLQAPIVAGTPVWCFRSATGRAEEAASCAP